MPKSIKAAALSAVAFVFLVSCGGGSAGSSTSTPTTPTPPGGGQPSSAPTAVLEEVTPRAISTYVPIGTISLWGSNFASSGTVNITGTRPLTGRVGNFSSTQIQFEIDDVTSFMLNPATYAFSIKNTGSASSNSLPLRVYEPQVGPQLFQAEPGYYAGEGSFLRPVVADFDRDGFADVVAVTSGAQPTLVLLHGRPDGSLQNPTRITSYSGQQPNALIAGDVNADGSPDLVIFEGGTNPSFSIYLNDGSGGFTLTQTVPTNAPVGYGEIVDLDQDGRPDIVLSGGNGTIQVAKNTGASFAAPITLFSDAYMFAISDFNNDGKPDIIRVVYGTTLSGRIALNQGGLAFADSAPATLSSAMGFFYPADLNGDGKADVIIQTGLGPPISAQVLFGNGDGTFTAGPSMTLLTFAAREHAADFDGDGKLDYYFAGNFLLGNGDGTFAAVPVPVGDRTYYGIGDINGDGRPDLVSGSSGQTVNVVLGRNDRSFPAPIVTGFSVAAGQISVADLNGDGRPDVFSSGGYTVGTTALNLGNGHFTLASNSTPAGGVLIADLDWDGLADLIGLNSNGVAIWRGDGSGTFSGAPISVPAAATAVDIADLDQDGRIDLIINGGILFNNGNFQFTFVPIPGLEMPVAVGDFNGDGKPDVIAKSLMLLNKGARQFTQNGNISGSLYGAAFTVGDFNADGKADLAIAQGGSVTPNTVILYGRADGTLRLGGALYLPSAFILGSNSMTAADFDGDGRIDIAVIGMNGEIAIFRNNGDDTFQRSFFGTGGLISQIIATDLNKDGKPDLLYQTYGQVSYLGVALHK